MHRELLTLIAQLSPNAETLRQMMLASNQLSLSPAQQFEARCRQRQLCTRGIRWYTLPSGRYDGPSVDVYSDGTVYSRTHYINGVLCGVYCKWFESGQMREFGTYIGSKRQGEYLAWYRCGQLYMRKNYVDGCLHGLAEYWHDNGRSWVQRNYHDGVIVKSTSAQNRSSDYMSECDLSA